MAVVDQYIDTTNIAGNVVTKLQRNLAAQGTRLVVMQATFEVGASDSNNSVYRVFKNLDPNLVPLAIMIANDASLGTSWGLGLYKPDLGAVLSATVFMSAQTLAVAAASLNPKTAKDGLANLDIANCNKRIFEHAGHTITTRLAAYDLALTAASIGGNAGTISVLALFADNA